MTDIPWQNVFATSLSVFLLVGYGVGAFMLERKKRQQREEDRRQQELAFLDDVSGPGTILASTSPAPVDRSAPAVPLPGRGRRLPKEGGRA